MNKIALLLIVIILILTIVGLTNSQRKSVSSFPRSISVTPTAGTYKAKEIDKNNVISTVTPTSLSSGKELSFDITFSTHSVDLDFDVAAVSKAVDDAGNSYGQARWNGSPPGGHHRNGVLTFATALSATAKAITLTLALPNLDNRTFSWEIK